MRVIVRWIALVITCALAPGCLLNSVHPITTEAPSSPDLDHAIVVIGMGLDVTWQYTQFGVTLPEYSVKKQGMTGNCFRCSRRSHPSADFREGYLSSV